MRLTEIKQDYKIYCDLDGVLVDFETKAMAIMGLKEFPDANRPKDEEFDKKLWDTVRAELEAGRTFWEEMNELPDARMLWNYIVPHHPEILTSTGKDFYEEGT